MFKNIYKKNTENCKQDILDLTKKDESSVILDCGCWNGEFTLQLMAKIRPKEAIGIEIVEKAAKEARKKGITVYQADLNKGLKLRNNSTDVVIANQIIEHLYNTDFFISEIYRVLKPGGYAIISTNNLAAWHNIFSLLFGKQPFPADVSNNYSRVGTFFKPIKATPSWTHMRIFTASSLKQICGLYGFKIEKVIGTGYYPFFGLIAKFFANLDKKHAAYLTIKIRKAEK